MPAEMSASAEARLKRRKGLKDNMSKCVQAIILAAGSGRRFRSVSANVPKCMLSMGGQTILSRLIRQLSHFGIDDLKVVVGYEKAKVVDEIARIDRVDVTIIENKRYKEDVNILSLTLALREDPSSCYVFEADCLFENSCFELICDSDYADKSVWYSCGDFTEDQHGGIIRADRNNRVTDVGIVKEYDRQYKDYKKMIGALKIGPKEIQLYCDYLFRACDQNIKQYYHMPWIEHIEEFESYLCDLGDLNAASFNTVEDYYKAKEIFSCEAGEN